MQLSSDHLAVITRFHESNRIQSEDQPTYYPHACSTALVWLQRALDRVNPLTAGDLVREHPDYAFWAATYHPSENVREALIRALIARAAKTGKNPLP